MLKMIRSCYITYINITDNIFYEHMCVSVCECVCVCVCVCVYTYIQFPWWLSGKESASNVGDMGSIPGSGRFPGEGN